MRTVSKTNSTVPVSVSVTWAAAITAPRQGRGRGDVLIGVQSEKRAHVLDEHLTSLVVGHPFEEVFQDLLGVRVGAHTVREIRAPGQHVGADVMPERHGQPIVDEVEDAVLPEVLTRHPGQIPSQYEYQR